MTPVIVTAILVLVIGSAIAVGWWAIADKVFPSSRRSSRTGGERTDAPRPTVVRGFSSGKISSGDAPDHPSSAPDSAR